MEHILRSLLGTGTFTSIDLFMEFTKVRILYTHTHVMHLEAI